MARIFTDFSLRSPACIPRLKSLLKNAGFPLNIHFLIDEQARAQTKNAAPLMQKWLSVLLLIQPHGFLLPARVRLQARMAACTCLCLPVAAWAHPGVPACPRTPRAYLCAQVRVCNTALAGGRRVWPPGTAARAAAWPEAALSKDSQSHPSAGTAALLLGTAARTTAVQVTAVPAATCRAGLPLCHRPSMADRGGPSQAHTGCFGRQLAEPSMATAGTSPTAGWPCPAEGGCHRHIPQGQGPHGWGEASSWPSSPCL